VQFVKFLLLFLGFKDQMLRLQTVFARALISIDRTVRSVAFLPFL
jgi:hypothetical protein